MFFFFPYSTDAPIYHWPIVTVLLIVVNTVLFFLTGGATSSSPLVLHFDRLMPWTWITANFMHTHWEYLLGNMLFLWPFGLVIEGKLGWFRFLLAYLGIGALVGAVSQLIMLAFHGADGALGASAILFGLMALTIIWAPKNNLIYAWFVLIAIKPRYGISELSIPIFGLCFVLLQVALLAYCSLPATGGFVMSSAVLHLIGFAAGFPLGVAMLKLGWVDCEGWDLFSVLAGKRTYLTDKAKRVNEDDVLNSKVKALEERSQQRQRETDLELIVANLAEGRVDAAYAVFTRQAGPRGTGWELPEPVLVDMIQALHHAQKWAESMPLLRQLADHFPARAPAAWLKLAQVLIQAERRPRQALAVLSKLPAELPEPLGTRRGQLTALAKQSIEEGDLEVAVEDW